MSKDASGYYHRLFGTQERIDLHLLIQLWAMFKGDPMINCNIRFRVEKLTEPRPLQIHEQQSKPEVEQ